MIRRCAVLLAVALLPLTAACGSGSNEAGLDPYLCTQDDVGEDFQELARGNFSPRDLADLGPNAGDRVREFRDGGMERGRFAFFKQSLPKPPFAPPLNVLCQVIEFESHEAALSWVTGLEPNDIASNVVGWLPEAEFSAEDPNSLGSKPDQSRLFIGQDEERTVAIHAAADGKRARLLGIGFGGELIDPPWESWPPQWQAWVLGR